MKSVVMMVTVVVAVMVFAVVGLVVVLGLAMVYNGIGGLGGDIGDCCGGGNLEWFFGTGRLT